MKSRRPLGAFLSEWTEDSINILLSYGFIPNGIIKKEYRGEIVNILKFKTIHMNDEDMSLVSNDVNMYHNLDFYVNEEKKLKNTDVYTTCWG